MRSFLRAVTVLLALGIAATSAAGTAQSRSAQVIAMAAGQGADAAPPSDRPPATGEAIVPASAEAAFRVHDLSRRWVEYQMADSFTGVAAEGTGAAPPEAASATPLPPPAIPIPAWMLGDRFPQTPVGDPAGCAAGPYRPAGFLSVDAETRRRVYYDMMRGIACEHGIPVGLFDALIINESRYRPDAVSHKNAFGLTQLMPDTATGLGVNRYDILDNLRGGARYLRQQLDRFRQPHLALAAYNAGPGRVRGGEMPPFPNTRAYVRDILLDWRRLAGASRPVDMPPAIKEPASRHAAMLIF
ncbi:lytic transglycosylase domain-containing protein [Sphingomonas sp. H39-1-10]|uniref:lytic transglycosylase domain-containing protein n=1 Tax=Sphingomonas pollutisoli TaxID=3030829 RepID=UPI0023B92CDF|nr:lytic transglycosylase domain-containing protein [Sphingomonas pollutisoli]MDF0490476.1 lytic transglycosylase domain-containing protein [Sphingomonas pollutisoli]